MFENLSRRTLLASLLIAAAGRALAQDRPRGSDLATRITDPRISTFDIGPPDAPWRIFCGLPTAPPPAAGYSVIMALDGNGTFPLLWNLREELAPDAPVLLVGIGYPVDNRLDVERRWFDLTSPATARVPPVKGQRGPGNRRTGGNSAFLEMIAQVLIPEVAARFPVDTGDMTLFGHSLGGLFTLHALIEKPRLFARYAAADASTWWNSGEMLDRISAFAAGVSATSGRVSPEIPVLISNSGEVRGDVVALLLQVPGIAVTYRPHPEESHNSVLMPAAREALVLHRGSRAR